MIRLNSRLRLPFAIFVFLCSALVGMISLSSAYAEIQPEISKDLFDEKQIYQIGIIYEKMACSQATLPTTDESLRSSYIRFEKTGDSLNMEVARPCINADGKASNQIYRTKLSQHENGTYGFKFETNPGSSGNNRWISGFFSLAQLNRGSGILFYGLYQGSRSCNGTVCAGGASGLNDRFLIPVQSFKTIIPGCGLTGSVRDRLADCAKKEPNATVEGWRLVVRTKQNGERFIFPKEIWMAPDETLHATPDTSFRASTIDLLEPKKASEECSIALQHQGFYEAFKDGAFSQVEWSVPVMKNTPSLHSELDEYQALGASNVLPGFGFFDVYPLSDVQDHYKSMLRTPEPFSCQGGGQGYFVLGPSRQDQVCNLKWRGYFHCIGRVVPMQNFSL